MPCVHFYVPGKLIEVSFCLECVYPFADRTLDVCDALITNLSSKDIGEIHLLYPHPVVTILKDKNGGFRFAEDPQSHRFREATPILLRKRHKENWFYEDVATTETGGVREDILKVCVPQEGRSPGLTFEGWVAKHEVFPHPELNPSEWRVLEQEPWMVSPLICRLGWPLKPGDSVWIRLRFFPWCTGPYGPARTSLLAILDPTQRAYYRSVGPEEVRLGALRSYENHTAQWHSLAQAPDYKQIEQTLRSAILEKGFMARGTYTRCRLWHTVIVPDRFLEAADLHVHPSSTSKGQLDGPLISRMDDPRSGRVSGKRIRYWQFIGGYQVRPRDDAYSYLSVISNDCIEGDVVTSDRDRLQELAEQHNLDFEYMEELGSVVASIQSEMTPSESSKGHGEKRFTPADIHEALVAANSELPSSAPCLSFDIAFSVSWRRRWYIVLQFAGLISVFAGGLWWRSPTIALLLAFGLLSAFAVATKIYRTIRRREVRGD